MRKMEELKSNEKFTLCQVKTAIIDSCTILFVAFAFLSQVATFSAVPKISETAPEAPSIRLNVRFSFRFGWARGECRRSTRRYDLCSNIPGP